MSVRADADLAWLVGGLSSVSMQMRIAESQMGSDRCEIDATEADMEGSRIVLREGCGG